MIASLVALLVTLGAPCSSSVTPSLVQDDAFVRCTKCQNRGMRPCELHDEGDCELEGSVVFCTVIGECEACGGTGWVDCPHCENEAVASRLAERRQHVPTAAARAKAYSDDMGRPLSVVVTPHFELVWDVEKRKVGRKLVGRHELMHLYADRLEELFGVYATVLGANDEDFARPIRVLVWSDYDSHRQASTRYCDGYGRSGMKLHGAHPTYSVPATLELYESDEALHRNLVHHVTHIVMSHQDPQHWMAVTKGGWADAGLSHWFEDHFFGICDNYCFQESDTNKDFKGGKWKPAVRKMVQDDEIPPLAALFQQNTDTLSLEQHAVSFSLVDYLIAESGEKMGELLKELRRQVATRDALEAVYGVSPIQLQEAWAAWVLETYPRR